MESPASGEPGRSVDNIMIAYPKQLLRLYARTSNKVFFLYQIVKLYLSRKNKWKIVFSIREDWTDSITKGFRYTLHEITFSDLTRCSFQNYDLVIPLTIRDLKYLTGIRHQIEKNPIPIPGMECITLCDDKYLFNQTISDSGFRGLIPQSDGKLEYPYILKKRIDEWG